MLIKLTGFVAQDCSLISCQNLRVPKEDAESQRESRYVSNLTPNEKLKHQLHLVPVFLERIYICVGLGMHSFSIVRHLLVFVTFLGATLTKALPNDEFNFDDNFSTNIGPDGPTLNSLILYPSISDTNGAILDSVVAINPQQGVTNFPEPNCALLITPVCCIDVEDWKMANCHACMQPCTSTC